MSVHTLSELYDNCKIHDLINYDDDIYLIKVCFAKVTFCDFVNFYLYYSLIIVVIFLINLLNIGLDLSLYLIVR